MKTVRTSAILVCIVGAFVFSSVAQENTERRPARDAWNLVAAEATIEAVNQETRDVTLRGPDGELMTIKAGDNVKRLKDIEVGDRVHAEFWTYIKAEFRDPTPEEKNTPVVLLAASEKVLEGAPPAANYGAIAKAVVTIEIINRPDMLVTVKGPGGNFVAVPVEDAELLKELHIGEVVVLTYAEAVALSLEKAGSK